MRKALARWGGTPLEPLLLAPAFALSKDKTPEPSTPGQFWVTLRIHPEVHRAQRAIRKQVLANEAAFAVPCSNWQVAVVGVRSADAVALVESLIADPKFVVWSSATTANSYNSAWDRLDALAPRQQKLLEAGRLQLLVGIAGTELSEATAIPLEVWKATPQGNFASPGWNGSMSSIGPSDAPADLLRLDRKLVERSFHDIDFDIDAVYLWVDGSDPAWLERKRKYSGETDSHGTSQSRFTSRNELYFSIATLLKNAPWINRVWLVTDGQQPELGEFADKVTVVNHTDFIPAEYLPTFNSHVITAHLHRINGLSENFLYLNDDILFGRPLLPTVWFDSNGRSVVRYTRTTLPGFSVANPEVIHRARQQTVRLALDAGLKVSTRSIQHGPHPLKKSVMEQAWKTFKNELESTSRNRFRTDADVVPEWLHNFIAFTGHDAVLGGRLSYTYIVLNSKAAMNKILDLAVNRPPSVICLNDVSEIPEADRAPEKIVEYRLKVVAKALLKP